jgi:hypothetical protein
MSEQQNGQASRRDFLKTTTAAVVGGTLTSTMNIPGAWAAGSDEIRVGVIGCGGRGTGAVENAINSAEGVRLVAAGDLFPDRLAQSLENLKKLGDKTAVPANRQFTGWDAFEKVIATDANYIILATPPTFRPMHLKAAIAARTSSPRNRCAWTRPATRRSSPPTRWRSRRGSASSPARSAGTTARTSRR